MSLVPRRSAVALLAALVTAWLAPLPSRAQEARVTVFAAASLKNALDEIATAWTRRTGTRIVVSYAASSALARQIEQGAPADLFISADLDWMAYLVERNEVRRDTVTNLVSNSLVLIAPADSRTTLAIAPGFDLAGALGGGRLAVADVAAVPAGKYAKAALETLKAWDLVKDKLAMAENVRAALALVARGEAPLGIVYETDARAERGVRVVGRFPRDSYPPVIYPAALTTGSTAAQAAAFLVHLRGPEAARVFQDHGFALVE